MYSNLDRRSARQVKSLSLLIDYIEAIRDDYASLTDDDLKDLTRQFRQRLKAGESLDELLPEAFAAVCEASRRVLNMSPYREQIIGGIILHQGKIAELKTGEGKTLVATFPAYLNALPGKGVHVITVNDYLAARDKAEMSQVYSFLGLTTGLVLSSDERGDRKAQYDCDITYVTNSEAGFDYLRDNMSIRKEDQVQRGLVYCIIDEVDSILIDESRTPLIISSPGEILSEFYSDADRFVKTLKAGSGLTGHTASKMDFMVGAVDEDGDFNLNEKDKAIALTDAGIKKAEEFFHLTNFADKDNIVLQHAVNMSLRANYLMTIDKDYIVRDGEVMIVDEFTGRVMDGRRFADGLHQALEAKEGVEIHPEDNTLATITYQSLFNKYRKKSGMTGTAVTERKEFKEIYHMDVVCVPTHKPIARIDGHDIVYASVQEKFEAVADKVREIQKTGQPVLVGTATVEDSERLDALLSDIPHTVLNAKQDKTEADTIALAGQYGAVTIATNMAGRGTDIKLSDAAREAGGLFVIGTQRHESRRIDNQLIGRSGRQGDPGHTLFYLSLEDELLRLFGSDKIRKALEAMHLPDGQPIRHAHLTGAVAKAQRSVEANNLNIRKNLVEYDSVIDKQRTLIYNLRAELMQNDLIKHVSLDMLLGSFRWYQRETDSREEMIDELSKFIPITDEDREKLITMDKTGNDYTHDGVRVLYRIYDRFETTVGSDYLRHMERLVILHNIDKYWVQHINDLERLRPAVRLQQYAQKDPVVQFQIESYKMFDEMLQAIREASLKALFSIEPQIKLGNGVEGRLSSMHFQLADGA